jgi:hypothetical protein
VSGDKPYVLFFPTPVGAPNYIVNYVHIDVVKAIEWLSASPLRRKELTNIATIEA